MTWRSPQLLFLLLISSVFCLAQQNSSDGVFTISVAAPTAAANVQVRFFMADEAGKRLTSGSTQAVGNTIVVKAAGGAVPHSFKAIAFAPGCQFVTISVDDLSAGTRQAEFQCQPLSTVTLRGHADLGAASQQGMQLESLYVCSWAQSFFGVPKGAISPFSLGKSQVASDGSFTVELPDFSRDPLWSSLSSNAGLMFYLAGASGQRVAALKSPAELSRSGMLSVAPSYPDVEFTLQLQNQVRKQAKTHTLAQ